MNRFRMIIPLLGLFGAGLAPGLRADEWDKETYITVSQPLQIEETVLAKGKYVLRLVDSDSDRHVVRIYDANDTQVKATILAIPTYRLEPTGMTQLSMFEAEGDQPAILRSWFYPGDNVGLEFRVPKRTTVIGQSSDFNGKATNGSHIPDRPTSTQ
jgi:hypothetical protein